MTQIYYYIAAGTIIDATTRIYDVRIGESPRQQAILAWLTAHAAAHNHFFHIRDLKTSEFVHRIIHSIDGVNLSPVQISALDLKKSLTSGEDFPVAHGTLHTKHVQRSLLDLEYRVSNRLAANSK